MEYKDLVEEFARRYNVKGLVALDGVAAMKIDDFKVLLIHNDIEDAITVYGEIGEPPPDLGGRFGGTLLKADHLFQGTGGAVLCQNPDNGVYVIFRSFPLASLDMNDFCTSVGKIVDQIEDWKRLMEGFQAADEAAREKAAESSEFSLGGNNFMQV